MKGLPASVLCAVALLGGCAQDSATPRTKAAEQTPAPAADALCAEHGVLESVCTRCNPALIPVFKAKGDFCAEHGFAESFCPICHPERKGRPDRNVSSGDDGPVDGTTVRFKSHESAGLAGLRYVAAVQRPVVRDVSATARIVYDAARVAEVNPRAPGVVRAIKADVGTTVRAGAVLAVLESADVGATQARWQAARARLDAATATFERQGSLLSEGLASQRALQAAEEGLQAARAEVRATESALSMVGARPDGSAKYTLTAPISGVVNRRGATIGRLVDASAVLFEIVDSSSMWVEIDVPETDVGLVAVGQSVKLTLEGVVREPLHAQLAYVASNVDSTTRTTLARAALPNPDGQLRANVFGRALISVSDPLASVLVPRSAVQRARDVSVVFVRLADDTFEARRVEIQASDGELLGIRGRVVAGDLVVSDGSFLLKTEILKDSMGSGCCEVD